MELINNRYRVIRSVQTDEFISSYIVSDIKQDHHMMQMNILSGKYISEALLKYLSKEFITLRNVNNSYLTRLHSFGLLSVIDNKSIDDPQYYYTKEYIESNLPFKSVVHTLSKEQMLEIFIQLCHALNTLHLKGIVYGAFQADNIYFLPKSGKYSIKLKDLATVEIERTFCSMKKVSGMYFAAPELLKGRPVTAQVDQYALGVLLFLMVSKKVHFQFDFEHDFEVFKQDYKNFANVKNLENGMEQFLPIIEKMTAPVPQDRFKDMNELISHMNEIFHTQYSYFILEDMDKVNLHTRLIGREEEIGKVMGDLESQHNLILVHGEMGIGKTRFLRELGHLYALKNYNVYTNISMDASNEEGNSIIKSILGNVIAQSSMEILEKYETELVKIIPGIGQNRSVVPAPVLTGEKEELKLINRTVNFIQEVIQERPTIFIIDNIHTAEAFCIKMVEYIFNRSLYNGNIKIILSYCNNEPIISNSFNKFIKQVKSMEKVLDITLSGLSMTETARLIERVLCLPTKIHNFSSLVYSKTYGNPLFIKEILKDLFFKKIIYVNQKGTWSRGYAYEAFPLPANLEQAVLSQVSNLDETSVEILKVVSVFNKEITLQCFSFFFNVRDKALREKVEKLCDKGIISQIIRRGVHIFQFNNRMLKNLIYATLSAEEKKEKHELAAMALEKTWKHENEDNGELIYHLEKAEKREQAIAYCIEKAQQMKILKNAELQIKFIKKALSMFHENSTQEKRIQLLDTLGDIYKEQGKVSFALSHYEMTAVLSERAHNLIKQIDALNKIISLYLYKNEINKAEECLKKAEKLVKEVEYREGFFKVMNCKIQIWILQGKYEKALALSKDCLNQCKVEEFLYKGRIHQLMGNIHADNSDTKQALEDYHKSIYYYEKANYTDGFARVYNNIGAIYFDYEQDIEKGMECFLKLRDFSRKNNMLFYEVLALSNIGGIYFSQMNYELVFTTYKEVLKKAKEIQYENIVFYSYTSLTECCIKQNKLKEAYGYHLLAKKELSQYPQYDLLSREYDNTAGKLFFEFRAIEEAEAFLVQALQKFGEEEKVKTKWECEIILAFVHLLQHKVNEKETMKFVKEKIQHFIHPAEKIDLFLDTALFFMEINNTFALKSLELAMEIKDFSAYPRIQAKLLAVECILMKDHVNLEKLDTALAMAQKEGLIELTARLYNSIGDWYLKQQQGLNAINYYLEACEIVKDLAKQVPRSYRLNYIQTKGLLSSFNMLHKIRRNIQEDVWDEYSLHVSTEDALEKLFNYEEIKDLAQNKSFLQSAQKLYKSMLCKGINEIRDIIRQLESDPIHNLNLILGYLTATTLGTKGTIVEVAPTGEVKTVVTAGVGSEVMPNPYIMERVRTSKKAVVIENSSDIKHLQKANMLPSHIKACICIPIITSAMIEFADNTMANMQMQPQHGEIAGYIYIEAEKVLNNINENSLQECEELTRLITFNMEKHKLKLTASMDKLTNTLTRQFLEHALDYEIQKCAATKGTFSIILFDLDHFKGINDRYGHLTGDKVLQRCCKIILDNIGEKEICGRYGGEEFIIILPEKAKEKALSLAETLRKKVQEENVLKDDLSVTVSMGIATYPQDAEWKQELIEKADQALYVAKEKGRNRCQVWERQFSNKEKVTNKLTGIISGNAVQDYRNVLAMVELIDLIKEQVDLKEKIYMLLGRIIEITEAQYGMLFIIDQGKVVQGYTRKIFEEKWIEGRLYNEAVLKEIIHTKQGTYMVDWDEIMEYDLVTGMPNWQSVLAVPLIKEGVVKGILYLTVSIKLKEFNFNQYNFVQTLGQLVAALL